MKTIYGIKQKYDLKDCVRYYSAINGKGEPCNEQVGYINSVEYGCNLKGEIELAYVVSDWIGCRSGHIVSQERIIKRVKPKIKNYGYKEYIQRCITGNEKKIASLLKQNKEYTKTLKEFEDEEH